MRLCPKSFTQCIFVSARAHAVIPAPFSPDGAAEVFRRAKGLVPGDRTGRRRLPRFRVPAWRHDGMGAPVGDGVMTLAGIVRTVGGDRAELHVSGDLIKQLGQHRRVTDVAAGDLDGSDLQRLFIDADVDLAPYTAFCAAVLASMPFAFALCLDAGAVDQQVQRPTRAAVGNSHGQGLPAPPLALAKAFSRSGSGRVFSLFSRVMRVGLSTGLCAMKAGSVLSGPVFSRPHDFADLVNFFQHLESMPKKLGGRFLVLQSGHLKMRPGSNSLGFSHQARDPRNEGLDQSEILLPTVLIPPYQP